MFTAQRKFALLFVLAPAICNALRTALPSGSTSGDALPLTQASASAPPPRVPIGVEFATQHDRPQAGFTLQVDQRPSLQDAPEAAWGMQGLASWSQRHLSQLGYVGARLPWQFNGVTGYFATPSTAGQVSLAGNAKFQLFADGTAKLGAGVATSSAVAASLTNSRSDPTFDRPFVSTLAYVTVPRLLGWTTFPTVGYNLAEGRGNAFSASNGYFAVGELAYNGLSNSFGVSLSQAQAGSMNVPLAELGSGLVAGRGFSGIEQIGGANSLTLLSDPRTSQFAQSIAYPFNILTPANPMTCTQTMIASAVTTWGDLSGPVNPTPGNQPLFIIPFCAEFFNLQVLDSFNLFLQDYLDYYYNYDQAYYDDYGLEGEPAANSSGTNDFKSGGSGQSRGKANSSTASSPSPPDATHGSLPVPPLACPVAANGSAVPDADPSGLGTEAAILHTVARVQPPWPGVPGVTPAGTSAAKGGAKSPAQSRPKNGADNPTPSQIEVASQSRQSSSEPNPVGFRTASLQLAGFGAQPVNLAVLPEVLPASPADLAFNVTACLDALTLAQRIKPSPTPGPPAPADPAGEEAMPAVALNTINVPHSHRVLLAAPPTGLAPYEAPQVSYDNLGAYSEYPTYSSADAPSAAADKANATNTTEPRVTVARTPQDMLPSSFRQSPQPKPQDIQALVKLGQAVAAQLQQLPGGRLAEGVAAVAANAGAQVAANITAALAQPLQSARNLSSQVGRLGAQLFMSTFMGAAQAVLPLTHLAYNSSAAWYQGAAGASNKLVDSAILGLSSQADSAASAFTQAAQAVQALAVTAAQSAADGYTQESQRLSNSPPPPSRQQSAAQDRGAPRPGGNGLGPGQGAPTLELPTFNSAGR